MLRSDSNPSSEKNHFNSAGQDVAKSMMSLLLPQAVPLLRNVSTDEKLTLIPSDILPSMATNSKEEQNEVGCVLDVPSCGNYTYPCYFNFSSLFFLNVWHRLIHSATWVFGVPCLLNILFVAFMCSVFMYSCAL